MNWIAGGGFTNLRESYAQPPITVFDNLHVEPDRDIERQFGGSAPLIAPEGLTDQSQLSVSS